MKAKRLIRNSVVCFAGISLIISGFVIYGLYPLEIPLSEKNILANAVKAEVVNKIEKKYSLSAFGTGAQMLDQIELLSLEFQGSKNITISEAREEIINSCNIFLNEVNTFEKIQPFLANHPFTAKNIRLCIFLYARNYKSVPTDKIALVKCINGKIRYYFGTEKETDFPRFALEETYEEAVAKVEATKMTLQN